MRLVARLGAVINSQGVMQSPVVREHAGIAGSGDYESGGNGWPDCGPANGVVSHRKAVEEAATFVGFGGKPPPPIRI